LHLSKHYSITCESNVEAPIDTDVVQPKSCLVGPIQPVEELDLLPIVEKEDSTILHEEKVLPENKILEVHMM
jgi:hypothetical protein